MSRTLPKRIPACVVNLLARPEWFTDPEIVGRVRLNKATGLAGFLSSHWFAHAEVSAITLDHTIHIRRQGDYNPHTVGGLALLAHEIKHAEQCERMGWPKFCAKYLWAYLFHGYGEAVPFEAEAYQFEWQVAAHLKREFDSNLGCVPCTEMAEPHTPNTAFIKTAPEVFRFSG